MDACLYHSNKCGFDNATRDIQRSKILPTPQSKRLAMCVCSCRKKRFDLSTETTQKEIQDMAEFLGRCTQTEAWPASVTTLLRPVLKDIYIDNYSPCVLVLVLYRAVKLKNYDLLESLMRKNNPRHGMTPVQFNYMINKKWRNSSHKMEFIVPLFAGNLKRFESDDNVKQIKTELKDVVLKVCHAQNGHFMEQNLKKMKIKLGGKNESEVKRIGQEMVKIGLCIQNNLDEKRSVEYERRKIQRQNRTSFHNLDFSNDNMAGNLTQISLDHKSSLEDFYVRRVESNKISGKPKSDVNSPLKDGHCINCLDKFTSLKDAGECKYHPGFIGCDKKWSCCDTKTLVDHPTYQFHLETGCSTGIHNWRHGKDVKRNKKHRNSSKLSLSPKSNGGKFDNYLV